MSDDNHKAQCAQNCVNAMFCFGLAKTDQLLTFRLFKVFDCGEQVFSAKLRLYNMIMVNRKKRKGQI